MGSPTPLNSMKYHFFWLIIPLLFLYSCSPGPGIPIEKIKSELKDAPDYSIILEDMKEEGNFITQYFHKYRVVRGEESLSTGWEEVSEKYYKTNEAFLGMTLTARKDGENISSVAPPGYQYIGDSRYGQWTSDHRGGSFWEFYGKYALFSSLLGGLHRPVYRNDFGMYQTYRNRNRPFFGAGNQYGTNGSVTKQTKPNFYTRHKQRKRLRNKSFSDRVSSRTGRTRTGFRSRSGGFGK